MKPVFGTLFIKDSCISVDWTVGYIKENTAWIPHIPPKFRRNECGEGKKLIPKKEINITYKAKIREGKWEGPDPDCFPWYLPGILNTLPDLSEEELESKILRLCKTEGVTFLPYNKNS